jgi:RNA polymerase sigma factor (sigma-70 family)
MLQTRASLLLRIRDPKDALAWSDFVQIYAPVLHAYGMKNGLQDCDAADMTQDTLRNVFRAAPEFVYEPTRGTFRGWLFAVARNEVHRFRHKNTRRPVASGDSNIQDMLAAQPDRFDSAELWEHEYQLNLFHWAALHVQHEFQDKSWQAFWRTAVSGEDVESVAIELGMTRGAVYIARSRVTARIREEVQKVEGDAS